MPATLVWFSGLETGGPVGGLGSEFDAMSNGGGGTPTYQTLTKRSGNYGLLTPHDGLVRVRANFASNATTFLRLYFRVTSNPTNTVPIVLSANSTSSSARGWRVFLTSTGVLGWSFNNLGGNPPDATGGPAVSLTDWNLLEVKFVRDAAVGGMEIFLNGTLVVSDFTHSTTSGTSLTTTVLFFGNDLGQPGTNQSGIDINWDDLAFAISAYVGAGQSVAIQGKSGAPTYNAWTKNGAADSFNAWSQTPWDGSKNCSDSTSGDRQTMLVDDAALLAAIPSAATINGALVAFVGHSTTATGNVARTRRIGGVDTDGAQRSVPITTDTFMPQGQNLDPTEIFVDTRANLASAEIGVVRGAQNTGTGVVTVEDVWLLVDFSAPASSPVDRLFDVPFEASGLVTLPRRFTTGAEWTAPPKRLFGVPFEFGPIRIFRRFGVPWEYTQSATRIFRPFGVPVEWTGGTPGVLLLQWNVIDLMNIPLPVRWNVIQANESASLMLQWTVRDTLPVLHLVWRVVPDLITPFTTTPVHIPTSTVTEIE